MYDGDTVNVDLNTAAKWISVWPLPKIVPEGTARRVRIFCNNRRLGGAHRSPKEPPRFGRSKSFLSVYTVCALRRVARALARPAAPGAHDAESAR